MVFVCLEKARAQCLKLKLEFLVLKLGGEWLTCRLKNVQMRNIWKKILRSEIGRENPSRQSNWCRDYAKSNKPVTRQQYGSHNRSARKVDLLVRKERKVEYTTWRVFWGIVAKLHRYITFGLAYESYSQFFFSVYFY